MDNSKNDHDHIEVATVVDDDLKPVKSAVDTIGYQGNGVLKSHFDELSIWRTLVVFRRAAFYSVCSYTLNMLDGWQISIAGAIIVNKGFVAQFGTQAGAGVLALDTTWVSAWGAIINVGQFVAISYIPIVANRFGRKAAFYCCWGAFIICLIFLSTAKIPAVWLLGKLMVGVAAGSAQMTTTPYVVEISPNRIRGGLATFQAVWSSAGGIICAAMLVVANNKYPDNYHLPLWVCFGLAGLMLIAIIIIPETPWFYARHNQKEKAFASMKRLYGGIEGYDYEQEWQIMIGTIAHERAELARQQALTWRDIFQGLNGRRTLVVTMFFTAQLLAGLALISTYGTYLFSLAGIQDPFLASLILSIISLISILCYATFADYIGRRKPSIWAYTFTCASLWVIGSLYYAEGNTARTVLLVICCVWQACFTIFSNIYWVIAAELPSVQLRIKTGSFSLLIAASWGIITCFAVPPLLVALNLRAAYVFGGVSFPICIYLWLTLPETKGRAPAEIDELFERKIPAWRWVKTETHIEKRARAVFREEENATNAANEVNAVHAV